jgi:hypothetical protein
MRPITFGDLIFDEKVFDFLGQDLEAKYLEEIKKNSVLDDDESQYKSNLPYEEEETMDDNKKSDDGWTEAQDKKLIMLYKKKLPESALASIFKKRITEIRERILKILS